jgi:ADP-ribose pyrophosphatase YjhB (NUDIX family)
VKERLDMRRRHVVVFLLWDGQKLQLEKRMNPDDRFYGFIWIPGGKVKPRETLLEACSREVKEEYGVRVLENRELGIINETDAVEHIYLINRWEGSLTNVEGEGKSIHIEASLLEARGICKHPITQRILDFVEKNLPTKNS